MENPRILIVEDEYKVAYQIKRGLEENDFIAEIASDGLIGKNLLMSKNYDLLILDLNLPAINGFDLCKFIRTSKPALPIIMLTALSSMDDKLMGFEAGADDYIVKPFEFRELLARIRALLKRTSPAGENRSFITIANLKIDLDTKYVYRDDIRIPLTPKEFSLLEYLVRNQGKVLTRAEIAQNVWDINFDTGTNVIDVFVNFLRKKIDKDYDPKLIHTVYGIGFVLSAETIEK
jgi:two-component system, OmpR family, copper resistance phosphate regulon response regulator CusR